MTGRGRGRPHDESGQATAEFALVLPAVVIVILLMLQLVVIGHDYLVVMNAAREAARAAAVDPTNADAIAVVHRSLPGATVNVVRSGSGYPIVTATITMTDHTTMAFVGAFLPDVVITRSVTMHAEA